MRLGRLILVVATLITILVFPLVARDALQTVRMPNAYAAAVGHDPTGSVYQEDNENNNDGSQSDDNDDESDNEGEDEDNDNDDVECFASLNSNEEVPCDFDDNDNRGGDNDGGRVVRRRAEARGESVNRPTKCFDTREVGVVQLGTGSYDVTVQVMPHSSFGQTTRLTLHSVNPGSNRDSGGAIPAVTGGTLVDSVMFDLDAQSSCDGAAIGTLPNLVNMGIIYNVTGSVDKSKLQIVRLEGNSWVNVDTVPDPVPGNPYVSATVNMAGTYALIQKP
jgi:hypothetical protein